MERFKIGSREYRVQEEGRCKRCGEPVLRGRGFDVWLHVGYFTMDRKYDHDAKALGSTVLVKETAVPVDEPGHGQEEQDREDAVGPGVGQ